MYIISCPAQAT